MAYERINWQNEPSEATALNDVNLNKMDSAIYELDGKATATDTAITNLQDGKVDKVNGKGLSQVDNVTVTQHVAYGTVVSTIKTYKQDGTEVTSQVCNGIVVDSALSNSSTNPVQNKVVKSAIDEKSTVAISDTLETGTTLANITIDGTTTAIKGSDIEVDEELSPTSTNPVENKAIYDALNNLLPSKTVSGNPIAISDASGFDAKALTVTMNPIQDLHGYTNPWAGGVGKNKLNATGTIENCTLSDGIYTLNSVPSSNTNFIVGTVHLGVGDYKINGGYDNSFRININVGGTYYTSKGDDVAFSITTEGDFQVSCIILTTATAGKQIKPMIRLSTVTDGTFAPYSNICPISGRTEVSVIRTAGEDVETKTHQYSETIYGGVDDFVNGGAKVTLNVVDMGNLTYASGNGYVQVSKDNIQAVTGKNMKRTADAFIISSIWAVYQTVNSVRFATNLTPEEFKTLVTGQTLCYELATPTTISTSAEEITLLKGNNVLSTNADDMELKYSVSLDSLLTT